MNRDEHLKWDAQLQYINNKITKNIGILFKLRHYVPISTPTNCTILSYIRT